MDFPSSGIYLKKYFFDVIDPLAKYVLKTAKMQFLKVGFISITVGSIVLKFKEIKKMTKTQ